MTQLQQIELPVNVKTVIYNSYANSYLKHALEQSGYEIITSSDALHRPDLRNCALILSESNSDIISLIKRLDIDSLYLAIAHYFHDSDYGEYIDIAMLHLTTKEHYAALVDVEAEQARLFTVHAQIEKKMLDQLCASGHICSSCGGPMNEYRDFTHNCGDDVCYLCS